MASAAIGHHRDEPNATLLAVGEADALTPSARARSWALSAPRRGALVALAITSAVVLWSSLRVRPGIANGRNQVGTRAQRGDGGEVLIAAEDLNVGSAVRKRAHKEALMAKQPKDGVAVLEQASTSQDEGSRDRRPGGARSAVSTRKRAARPSKGSVKGQPYRRGTAYIAGSVRWDSSSGANLCAKVPDVTLVSGVRLHFTACDLADDRQHFLLPHPGTSGVIQMKTHPDFCLEVRSGAYNAGSGTLVQIWKCSDVRAAHQQFQMPSDGRGPVRWPSDPKGCFSVEEGVVVNGLASPLQVQECMAGDTHQEFIAPMVLPIPGAIQWARRQLCVHVRAAVLKDGAEVGLTSCDADDTRQHLLLPLPGSTGPIRLAADSEWCLDVGGGQDGPGAMQIRRCGQAAQGSAQFALPESGGPIRWAAQPDRCLDVEHGRGDVRKLHVSNCSVAEEHQQFIAPAFPDAIRWPKRDLCVDAADVWDGSRVLLTLCDSRQKRQQLSLPRRGTTGVIRLKQNEEYCLQAPKGKAQDGAHITLGYCCGAQNMQFSMPANGTGQIALAAQPRFCLDVERGSHPVVGLQLSTCAEDGSNQKFVIFP